VGAFITVLPLHNTAKCVKLFEKTPSVQLQFANENKIEKDDPVLWAFVVMVLFLRISGGTAGS